MPIYESDWVNLKKENKTWLINQILLNDPENWKG